VDMGNISGGKMPAGGRMITALAVGVGSAPGWDPCCLSHR